MRVNVRAFLLLDFRRCLSSLLERKKKSQLSVLNMVLFSAILNFITGSKVEAKGIYSNMEMEILSSCKY